MMESTGPANTDPVNTDEWTVMPPRLMRLEERIVLDAAGMPDGGSDSDSPDDAQHERADRGPLDTLHAEDKATSGDRDGRSDTPDGSGRGTAEPDDPMDEVNRLVASAIEKAIRPVAERADDLAVLEGLLDGLHAAAGDATTSDAGSAAQWFSLLSDALQNIFDGGLTAMLNQQPSARPVPEPQDDLNAVDVQDTDEADPDASPAVASPVLVVSSSIDQASALAAAAGDDVISMVFDGKNMTPDELLRQIQDLLGDQKAQSIALATNGLGDGGFELTGGVSVNLDTLQDAEMQAFWMGLAEMVEPGGRIDLLACDAAAGSRGQELLASLEGLTGVNFAASTDKTGNADHGGDWVLESDDIDTAEVYFDADGVSGFTAVLGDLMPTIGDTNPGNTATGAGGAVVVDAGITVDDGDGGGDDLQGAVVRIKTGFVSAQDQLAFNSGLATGFGISGSYNAATGELILAGVASATEYQQVLRTVTYENTSVAPDTTAREILFAIGDDFDGYSYYATNGHYYQYVDNAVDWATADAAADGTTLGGLQGYLGTVTSAGENVVVTGIVAAGKNPWLGATDAGAEGAWFWVNGPEAGTQFWQGDDTGAVVGGMYANWVGGDPDHTSGDSYVRIDDTGGWDDKQGIVNERYIIEYGGMGSDAEGQLAASVTVNVVGTNNAPVLDNTGDMTLTAIAEDNTTSAGDTVAAIVASATGNRITDADGGALEGIAITAIDNTNGTWQYSTDGGGSWTDIGAVANNNALLLRDTDLVRFQPSSNWNGTVAAGITFRAWDRTSGAQGNYVDASTNGGATAFSTATETASLGVNAVNDAPTLANPLVDQTATEDVAFTYQFSSNAFSDADASDTLTYAATLADGSALPAWLSFNAGTRTFTGTPTDTDVGPVSVKVTTNDGNGGSVSDTFTITVANVNDVPTLANPLVDQTADEGTPFTYSFALDAFDDADAADTLTYTATLADGGALPGWLSFDAGTRTFSGTPGMADAGEIDVEVTADDGNGGTASDTFTITVSNVNVAPTVANPLADQAADEGSPFTYQFAWDTFDDADVDDTLTYAATLADGGALPGWLGFDVNTRTFFGTPTAGDIGTIDVKVTAVDRDGQAVTDAFTITVSAANHAPMVANPLADQTVEEGSRFTYQFAPGSFNDIDVDDTLSYSAAIAGGGALPNWLSFDTQAGVFSGTPTEGDIGTLSVLVTASDGKGGVVSDEFTITVVATPEVPPEEVVADDAEILNTPGTPTPTSTSDSSSSGSDAGADSGTSGGMDAGDAGDSGTSADAADGGDAADAGTATDAADGGDAADASDAGDAGDGGDAGGNASSDAGDAGGDAAGGEAGVAGAGRSSGRQGGSDVEHHEREEQVQLEAGQLTSQVSNVMLSEDLLSDDSQPEEFRDAWNAILGAYVASGDELSIYLQSAFRAVNESAVMYEGAEQAVDTLQDELALAGELDMPVDSDTLLAGVLEARDEVKAASRELQAAILAAAEAGQGNAFDRVLEDVISAALQSLMAANEQLFAETKALAAVTAVLRDARLAGDKSIEPEKIASANAQARAEARAAVIEMRERWDRIAQDVFSAFIGRLAAEKAGEAAPEQSG